MVDNFLGLYELRLDELEHTHKTQRHSPHYPISTQVERWVFGNCTEIFRGLRSLHIWAKECRDLGMVEGG